MREENSRTVIWVASAIAIVVLSFAGLLVIYQQNAETRRELQELATSVKSVQDDTRNIAQTISTQKEELAKTATTLTTTTQDMSDLKQRLAATTSKLDTGISETQSLKGKIDSFTSDQGLLKKRTDELDQGITGVKGALDRFGATIANLQQKLTATSVQPTGGSAPARITISDTLGVRLTPAAPLSGQDVLFNADGLQPWQRFSATFIGPDGVPAEWVTEDEPKYSPINGKPVTEATRYADGTGKASLLRIGTLDGEGTWKLQLKIGNALYAAPYQLSQLQLNASTVQRFGIDMRYYQALLSDVYYSAGIPSTQVLTLQSHLQTVRLKLGERLGIQSTRIPDLYLFANRSLFEKAASSIGATTTGLEAGFFTSREPYSGIYIIADQLSSELRQSLTHEYVHLLLEKAPQSSLPAWVNEGTATYYELSLGAYPDHLFVSQRGSFTKADKVKQTLAASNLIPLPQLESLREWNSQQDPVKASLQYSQAYMAIRYLVERYKEPTLIALLNELSKGALLPTALQTATGTSYAGFETEWKAWVATWQDAEREAVRQYYGGASSILKDRDMLSQRRATQVTNESGAPLSARVASRQEFFSSAKALEVRASQLPVPPSQQGIHQDLRTFLTRTVTWLQLELEYVQTGNDPKRLEANGMIPEIDARWSGVARRLNSVAFNYELQ